MLSSTPLCLRHVNYKARLKTRMVGFVPKYVPRKAKGAMVSLRSEASSGSSFGYIKTDSERLDNTGKKVAKVQFDAHIRRFCLFKEAKIKLPGTLKQHIQKPAPLPWLKNEEKAGKKA